MEAQLHAFYFGSVEASYQHDALAALPQWEEPALPVW
jgi:hypothetical protein